MTGPTRATGATRVVLVPGALALLPEYAGLVDPVAELRASCLEAVAWLGGLGAVQAHGSPQGLRVAQHLAAATGVDLDPRPATAVVTRPAVLVVANGSATRTEKAPGHLHPQAAAFDREVRAALTAPDPAALAAIDRTTAADVWAETDPLVWLGTHVLTPAHEASLDHDADPFGVQYWVVRWALRPPLQGRGGG